MLHDTRIGVHRGEGYAIFVTPRAKKQSWRPDFVRNRQSAMLPFPVKLACKGLEVSVRAGFLLAGSIMPNDSKCENFR